MEVKTVTRAGRKVQTWRLTEAGQFGCGHIGEVTTDWHIDRNDPHRADDRTGPASRQLMEKFAGDCQWCKLISLGGREFAGSEPPRA